MRLLIFLRIPKCKCPTGKYYRINFSHCRLFKMSSREDKIFHKRDKMSFGGGSQFSRNKLEECEEEKKQVLR